MCLKEFSLLCPSLGFEERQIDNCLGSDFPKRMASVIETSTQGTAATCEGSASDKEAGKGCDVFVTGPWAVQSWMKMSSVLCLTEGPG